MKKIIALFVVTLLAACADAPPPPVALQGDSGGKINLDVLTVVVVDRSNGLTADTPYAANNFSPTIANAIRQWAIDKIAAVGTTGQATIVIHDASLKQQGMAHADDWFTREQASKYTGHAAIEIDVSGKAGHGLVSAEAARFETLPEDPTAAERKNAYAKLLNGLMADLGRNLRQGVRDHISAFVAR